MRTAEIIRETKETKISLALSLDGGAVEVETSIGFFDHMLSSLLFYAGFGAKLKAAGDLHIDGHHTVEDMGIVIGRAFKEALGSKAGIRRFAHAYVPMDEALCFTAVDLGGRAFLVYDAKMAQELLGGYAPCLTEEFMRAFAMNGGVTLHQRVIYGKNAHHVTEGLYKSLGLALKEAVRIEGSKVTSTKGVLD